MDGGMESNKWLWQPHKTGPIYLRLTYRNADGQRKTFVRSLNTSHWPTARSTRDKEFAPIIRSIDEAEAKHELIHVLYPELEQKLQTGVHGGFTADSKPVTVKEVLDGYTKAMLRPGNFQTAEWTARRYATICTTFVNHIGADHAAAEITTEEAGVLGHDVDQGPR
ncbi:MAG: hypothetical protein A3K19_23920 [Lentisphaerae bacterium RIFOXYB12_FULL_65_16]|nr:MAG: hypothetical protein A3K18_30765 [Lentisphaerae bacterium RIFOXYA12_64_32]OGV89637.1 MAG: hypothetical protein A3K19_23920 [Lentisphaerae bacterium RIFOXYB12_FULL_65_16]